MHLPVPQTATELPRFVCLHLARSKKLQEKPSHLNVKSLKTMLSKLCPTVTFTDLLMNHLPTWGTKLSITALWLLRSWPVKENLCLQPWKSTWTSTEPTSPKKEDSTVTVIARLTTSSLELLTVKTFHMRTTLVTPVSCIHKVLTLYMDTPNTKVRKCTTTSVVLATQPTVVSRRTSWSWPTNATSRETTSSTTLRKNRTWPWRNVSSSYRPTSRIKNTFSDKWLRIKKDAVSNTMKTSNTKNLTSALKKPLTSSRRCT